VDGVGKAVFGGVEGHFGLGRDGEGDHGDLLLVYFE